jgi:23S rRNA maturation-related 3'-5' exoribonuclease YhaM
MRWSVDELVSLLDSPNREACRRILDENRELFSVVPGSTHNHQTWPGGYLDHVSEVMNIARALYRELDELRPLPFALKDALLVLFLHDIEKPWKYRLGADGHLEHIPELRTKAAQHAFRAMKLAEYGIVLTAELQNAMQYVEGELNDYTNRHRVMGPLAAFCHLCDITSARIWYDHPQAEHDPWPGPGRTRP